MEHDTGTHSGMAKPKVDCSADPIKSLVEMTLPARARVESRLVAERGLSWWMGSGPRRDSRSDIQLEAADAVVCFSFPSHLLNSERISHIAFN